MRKGIRFFWVLFIALMLFPAGICAAQGTSASAAQSQYARRFQNGAELYALSRWQEATIEFRRAQESAQTLNDWAQSLYWVILSELAFSDYGSALRDMDELERHAPHSTYTRDMVYHRARVYFIQGFFDAALVLFNRFTGSVTDSDRVTADRRAASFFWMGECLYSLGQFQEAEKFYSWVIARYPNSQKVEAASYRLDLIKQKKIESELLALLQLSHEESLRTSEDYQRTIRTYEHTLNIYQRRIADLANPAGMDQATRETQPQLIQPVLPSRPRDEIETYPEPEAEPEFVNLPEYNPVSDLNQNDDLIERAIQLRNDVQRILGERGTW
ncbi:MAG: hypothetical protein FWB73_07275 [Treponema sp.]|nr:hypothetical protein [Treponema sp.]